MTGFLVIIVIMLVAVVSVARYLAVERDKKKKEDRILTLLLW